MGMERHQNWYLEPRTIRWSKQEGQVVLHLRQPYLHRGDPPLYLFDFLSRDVRLQPALCLILYRRLTLMARTTSLFTTNALKSTARLMPYWVAFVVSTPFYGYISTRFKVIREPLAVGFLLYTAGVVGLATIEPGESFNQLAFAALAGLGFGGPIVLITAGVQLNVPHHLMATATAVVNSSRAVGATIFTSIYAAILSSKLQTKIPKYVAEAAAKAGLPTSSIASFVEDIAANNQAKLSGVPGVTPAVIRQGIAALKQAYADSLRYIFIVGAPFGLVACALCFLLCSYKHMMSYRVEAPVEDLHAKHHNGRKMGE